MSKHLRKILAALLTLAMLFSAAVWAEEPAAETPAAEVPAEEIPADAAPAEETPAEEIPADAAPAEETPAEETPAGETPAEEVPAGETAAEETPAEETPAEETPAVVLTDDTVIMTVNGNPYTVADFKDAAAMLYSNQYSSTADNYSMAYSYLSQDAMFKYAASKYGLDQFTDEELEAFRAAAQADWDEAVQDYVNYYKTGSETEEEMAALITSGNAYFTAQGYSVDMLAEQLRLNTVYTRIEDYVKSTYGLSVTAEEVQAQFDSLVETDKGYFEGNPMMYELYQYYYSYDSHYIPEGYRGVLQILLSVDADILNDYTTKLAAYEEQQSAEAAEEAPAEEPAAEEGAAEEAPAAETPAEQAEEASEPVPPEVVTEEPAEEAPAADAAEGPAAETAEEPAEEPAEDASEEPAEAPAADAAEEPAAETAEEPAEAAEEAANTPQAVYDAAVAAAQEAYDAAVAAAQGTYDAAVAAAKEAYDAAVASAKEIYDAAMAAAPAEEAAVVTLEDVEAARAAVFASVQDKLDEIYARIESGEPFASLIPFYNTDPGMQDESVLATGYLVHRDSILYDPSFISAAFDENMNQVGDVSSPTIGSYGIYIVYYLRDAGGPVELTDAIYADLESSLLSNKLNAKYGELIAEWKAESTFEYEEAAFTTLTGLQVVDGVVTTPAQ